MPATALTVSERADRELDHEVLDAQHDVAVAEVCLAGAGHQRVPVPTVSPLTISASRSSNSGDPTGYQQAYT